MPIFYVDILVVTARFDSQCGPLYLSYACRRYLSRAAALTLVAIHAGRVMAVTRLTSTTKLTFLLAVRKLEGLIVSVRCPRSGM